MSKTILILLDACGYDAAGKAGGYLENLVERGKAAKYRVRGGLPSSSRPMYESMLTGLPADEHGIVSNDYTRPSNRENLFSLTKRQGMTSCAAAYCWVSELYNACGPFDITRHRFQLDGDGDIPHGIYYWEDTYPDSHLLMDGEALRRRYNPEFLFLHTMGADDCGHKFGSDSREYRGCLGRTFELVGRMLDTWRGDGYDVIVTADHGMDEQGIHGGNIPLHREVPLYIFSGRVEPGDRADKAVSNLNVAPLVCRLLEIEPPDGMLPTLEIEGDF